MLRNATVAATIVSIYLLLYIILLHSEASLQLMSVLFFFSPVMVIYMVYTVLRYGKYEGKELSSDEEWGYQDKMKDDLGTF